VYAQLTSYVDKTCRSGNDDEYVVAWSITHRRTQDVICNASRHMNVTLLSTIAIIDVTVERCSRDLQLPISTVGATYGIRSLRRFNESSGTIWRQTGQGRLGWRHGVAVSGVRRMNEVNARRARLVPGG